MSVPEIDTTKARELLDGGAATFVDVRDAGSYGAGHIPGALHLSDATIGAFVDDADKAKTVVVYCFKGNSSIGGAAHLIEKGFKEVYSLSGGFEAWKTAGAPKEDGAPPAAPVEGVTVKGVTLSTLAKEKLTGYLASEPAESRVRVTAEPNGFGLSIDKPDADETTWEIDGVPFVASAKVASGMAGLTIDFIEKLGQPIGFKLEGGTPPAPPGKAEMLEDVNQQITQNKIMLFMKGTADSPACGFSARTVETLKSLGHPFGHKNVLESPQYRYVLSEVSSWPTIPQVFINGEFVGGCDIVLELAASGELKKLSDAAFA